MLFKDHKLSAHLAKGVRLRTAAASAGICALALFWGGGVRPALAEQKAATVSATATLSNVQGKVEIQAGGAAAARVVPASGAAVHPGDVVVVTGTADLLLNATHVSYRLAAGSRVRITDDGKTVRPISGPLPRRLPDLLAAAGASGSASGGAASLAEQQRRMRVLAPLLDGRMQASVSRGGDTPSSYAPLGLSPRFGIYRLPGQPLTLKWAGPNAPSAGASARFRVRIANAETGEVAFKDFRPADARNIAIPPGTLTPGIWYTVNVAMVDENGTRLPNLETTGSLRLLTDQERDGLHQALCAADTNSISRALLRAHAYETVGEVDEAIGSYELALRAQLVTPEVRSEIDKSLERLRRLLPTAPRGQ